VSLHKGNERGARPLNTPKLYVTCCLARSTPHEALQGRRARRKCRSASEVVLQPWASGQRYSMKDDDGGCWEPPPLQVSILLLEAAEAAGSREPLQHILGKTAASSQAVRTSHRPEVILTFPSSRLPLEPRRDEQQNSDLLLGAARRTIPKKWRWLLLVHY